MTTTCDLAVIGSGHNALITACYLARAGLKTLVLERNPHTGGGTVTREIVAPGFRHDLHSNIHSFIQANPLIVNDELALKSRYGLEYVYTDPVFSSVFPDGTSIVSYRDVDRTCGSIAAISPVDADAYRSFAAMSARHFPIIANSMFQPPAQLGPFWALLDQSPEGRELMGALQRSCYELISDWFMHEKVVMHMLKFVSEALTGPDEGGTGLMVYAMPGMVHGYPIGMPRGGSGALADALIKCLRAHGGEVRTNAEVAKVLTRGGRATGVRLVDGEEITARTAVVGTLHPHLLGHYLDGLDERLLGNARKTRPSAFSAMSSHFALTRVPEYHGGADAGSAFLVGLCPETLTEFRRPYDDMRYGVIPRHLNCGALVNSRHDATRAPPGKATLTTWTHVPYELADGGAAAWDARRDEIGARILAQYCRYASNITPDEVIGQHHDTPLDIERSSPSFLRGDENGIGVLPFQFGGHRPTPELAQYTVPGVERFYLTGCHMHPGGGVIGGGRPTAIRMCGDLNIDFDRLCG